MNWTSNLAYTIDNIGTKPNYSCPNNTIIRPLLIAHCRALIVPGSIVLEEGSADSNDALLVVTSNLQFGLK